MADQSNGERENWSNSNKQGLACGNKQQGAVDKADKKKQSQIWLIEEDLLIAVFVEQFGSKKWNIIADELKKRITSSNRNGK